MEEVLKEHVIQRLPADEQKSLYRTNTKWIRESVDEAFPSKPECRIQGSAANGLGRADTREREGRDADALLFFTKEMRREFYSHTEQAETENGWKVAAITKLESVAGRRGWKTEAVKETKWPILTLKRDGVTWDISFVAVSTLKEVDR